MQETTDEIQPEDEKVTVAAYKDDLEIDEYMNKAISELSLDQRLSPNIQTKSPIKDDSQKGIQETFGSLQRLSTPKLNDMSTSPIPIKSPSLIDAPLEKEEHSSIEKELIVDTENEQLAVDDNRGK